MAFWCAVLVQVTVYLYNWSAEHANQLEKLLSRHVMWHNARSHLVSCIAMQKMGLFHHLALCDLSAEVGSTVLYFFLS
jgi:hypothetical protein